MAAHDGTQGDRVRVTVEEYHLDLRRYVAAGTPCRSITSRESSELGDTGKLFAQCIAHQARPLLTLAEAIHILVSLELVSHNEGTRPAEEALVAAAGQVINAWTNFDKEHSLPPR